MTGSWCFFTFLLAFLLMAHQDQIQALVQNQNSPQWYCSLNPTDPLLPLCQGPATPYNGGVFTFLNSGKVLQPPFTVKVIPRRVPKKDELVCKLNNPAENDGYNNCLELCDSRGNCPNTTSCTCSWKVGWDYTYTDLKTGLELVQSKMDVYLSTNYFDAPATPKSPPALFYGNQKLTIYCPDTCVLDCRQGAQVRTTAPVNASTDATTGTLPLSSKFKILGGSTTCTLTSADGTQATARFFVEALGGCAQTCKYCLKNFENWACYTSTQQGLVIGLLVLVILSILAVLPKAFRGLWFFVKILTLPLWAPFLFLWCFRNSRAASNIGLGFRRTADHFSYYFMSPKDQDQNQELPTSSSPDYPTDLDYARPGETVFSSGGSRYVLRKQMMIPVFLIACLGLSGVSACEGTWQVLNDFKPDCTQDPTNGVTNCNITYSLTANLPSMRTTSCFEVRDRQNYQIGTVAVQVLDIVTTVSLTPIYYTAGWNVNGACYSCCPGSSDPTCTAETCAAFDGGSDPSRRIVDTGLLGFPGQTTCHTSDTGCGCTNSTECSVYCRYAIVPGGPAYAVMTTGRPETSVFLQMNTTFGGSSTVTTTTLRLGASETQETEYYRVFLGFSVDTDSLKLHHKAVQNPGTKETWWAYASGLGEMVPGDIGDIQGEDEVHVTGCSGMTCFQFNQESVAVIDVAPGRRWRQASPPGISRLSEFRSFPFTQEDQIWVVDGQTLTVNWTTIPEPMYLNINTLGPITYQRQIGVVCPQATVVGVAAGCFNCPLGASVTLLAYSSCTGGFVSLSVSSGNVNLTTVALLLTIKPTNYTVYFKTGTQNNDFTLTLSADPQHTTTAQVQFVARAYNPNPEKPDSDDDDDKDDFLVMMKDVWAKYPAAVIGVAVGLSFMVFNLILFAARCFFDRAGGPKVKSS